MDISISCGGNSTSDTSSDTVSTRQGIRDSNKGESERSGLVYVSLSISALLALVVFALVAILIVVCIFSRIKRSTGR